MDRFIIKKKIINLKFQFRKFGYQFDNFHRVICKKYKNLMRFSGLVDSFDDNLNAVMPS